MFGKIKFYPVARAKPNESEKEKVLVSIDKHILKSINKFKPRIITRQEAIRQILEYYTFERELKG